MSRSRLLAAACAGLFIFGIALVLLGTLFGLPAMRSRLELDPVRQGNLQALLLAGVFLATVVVGPLIDRFGNKVILTVSSVMVCAALVGFAAAHSFHAAVAYAVLLGMGGGGLNTSTNVLVSDAYGEDRGPMLNVLGIFFGVGALFVPLLVVAMGGPVSRVILAAATLAALCAVMFLLIPFPAAREAHGFSWREAARVVGYPGVLLMALLLLFESGNEAAMNGWTSTWMSAAGASVRTATAVLALFQLTMMAGRLIAARALSPLSKSNLVMLSAAGAVAGCGVMLTARGPALMGVGVALSGLCFAAVYPTTLAIAGDRYQRFSGTVFGVLFSIGLVGGITFPWGIGHISQTFGSRYAIAMPLGGAAMVGAIMWMIRRQTITPAE